MKFLSKSAEIAKEFDRLLRRYDRISGAVAWAGWGFGSCDKLEKAAEKIDKLVIGTHGFHTNPAFLERFLGRKNVRFVRWTGPVFHPKVYLFEKLNGDWSCIVGSANFTRPGFESNEEACLAVTSGDGENDRLKRDIDRFIERCRILKEVERNELGYYRAMWESRRQSPTLTETSEELSDMVPVSPLQKMSWAKFCREVKSAEKRRHIQIAERIELLAYIRRVLGKKSLKHLTHDQRKLIGGFGSPRDKNDSEIYAWAAFGSMWGAGTFKKLMNKPSELISDALDEIPVSESVSREHYMSFVHLFRKAFPDGKGDAIATASRLLAMKRPDCFLCIDGANIKRLRKLLGTAARGKAYERYWDDVIVRIQLSAWWRSSRPKTAKDAAIWEGRAAFIDSLCYEPSKRKASS